jgi:hypothetical protein
MPAIIEMRLRPEGSVHPDTRRLHGLACTLFERNDAAHNGQHKPFAVWPLRQDPAGQEKWTLRAAWLPDLPATGLLIPPLLRWGPVLCAVAESRQRSVSHAELATGPAEPIARLDFHSPVYFSHNGADVITPEPRLILGSYRRRWNASLPAGDPRAIDDDTGRLVHQVVHLSAFDLRTARMDSGHGHERTGFTGTATLRVAPDAPDTVRCVFSALMRFAEFGGTGAQTTHGFGATTVSFPGPKPARDG